MHGCSRTFRKLVEDIVQLQGDDELFLLGDYINKGPDSRGVIDYIFYLEQFYYLKGNHEQYLIDALRFPSRLDEFLMKGGDKTLQSFEVKTPEQIPMKYLEFFQRLGIYMKTDHCYLVHAGFNFSRRDFFHDDYAMINIRNSYDSKCQNEMDPIIHGHVPTPFDDILTEFETREQMAYSIDGGCVYNYVGMSYLVALDLTNWQLFSLKNCDK